MVVYTLYWTQAYYPDECDSTSTEKIEKDIIEEGGSVVCGGGWTPWG